MRCSVFVIFVWLVFMFARRLGSPPYRMLRCRFYVRTRRKNVFSFKCLYINKISMFLNSLCKLLSIRCLTCSKIQAIYFKIQGTYFKICALCFLRDALCFLQCWEKSGKSPGFRLENGGVRRENAIAFTVAPLRFPEIGKRTLLSGCVFCLEGKGVHAHLLLHGQQAVAACGREVVAQSYLVNEIKIRVENFIGSMSRQNTYE